MSMSTPFSRSLRMFSAIAAALAAGKGASAFEGIGTYVSRGKGRGTSSKRFGNRASNRTYPFSSDRQAARHQRQGQHMAVVNGFEIMQSTGRKGI